MNHSPALADILARRNHLSANKRRLLDALLNEQGIDPQGQNPVDAAQTDPPRRSTPPSPLVTIRAQGAKTPVFFVHALLGSVFHYHGLAALMDPDQPVYALQAPGLDGSEAPLDNVAAFADRYIGLVRSVQPAGPYRLGGYSLGGWIAFEMARQLVRQGEEVSRLLILGTDVPMSVALPLVFPQLAFLYQYQQDFEHTIVQPFLSHEQRIRLNSGPDQTGSPLARLVQAHNKAVMLYDPRPYSGKITLLETIEQQVRTPFDPSRGWSRLSLQEVETHLIPGNHLSMLNPPHVSDLAEKITLCLDKT